MRNPCEKLPIFSRSFLMHNKYMNQTALTSSPTPPQKLYKFRAIETKEDWCRLRSILLKCELYCPSPSSFNDPFDCKIPPLGTIEPNFARYLIDPSGRNRPTGPLTAHEENKLRQTLAKAQDRINSNGVLSLAASRDSTLMWSHYARDHRGIALEFDTTIWCSQMPYMAQQFFPVLYSEQRINLNLTRCEYDNAQFFNSTILTKDHCWESEQEWRILQKKPSPLKFPRSALTGIIFGCRTPEKTKMKLLKKYKNLSSVTWHQSELRTKQFGLDFKPYP